MCVYVCVCVCVCVYRCCYKVLRTESIFFMNFQLIKLQKNAQ